jgi:hypothetical protein
MIATKELTEGEERKKTSICKASFKGLTTKYAYKEHKIA